MTFIVSLVFSGFWRTFFGFLTVCCFSVGWIHAKAPRRDRGWRPKRLNGHLRIGDPRHDLPGQLRRFPRTGRVTRVRRRGHLRPQARQPDREGAHPESRWLSYDSARQRLVGCVAGSGGFRVQTGSRFGPVRTVDQSRAGDQRLGQIVRRMSLLCWPAMACGMLWRMRMCASLSGINWRRRIIWRRSAKESLITVWIRYVLLGIDWLSPKTLLSLVLFGVVCERRVLWLFFVLFEF